jgi:chromosome segregation ATPase
LNQHNELNARKVALEKQYRDHSSSGN